MNQNRSDRAIRITTLTLMLVYLLIGALIYDDYGSGPDEGIERQTSLVNFQYAADQLRIPIPKEWKGFLSYLPDLKTYRDRYYGTALHQPLVLIEALTNFQMSARDFYHMRHAYVFLNWFAAGIVFYFLLRRRFKNPWTPLAGWMILVLTPRFFAESFYNNKDILFTAWTIFSIAALDQLIRQQTVRTALIAGVILALTVNTRLNGLAYLPIAVLVWIVKAIQSKTPLRQTVLIILLFGVFFSAALYIVTPNLWESPFVTLLKTFRFSAEHPNHTALGNLYFGQLVDASISKTYVAVWIALTTPTSYLIFAILGGCCFGLSFIIKKFPFKPESLDFLVTASGFIPAVYIIARHVTIYNTWRHLYFVYPSIVYLAAIGVEVTLNHIAHIRARAIRTGWKIGAIAVIACSLGINAFWIAVNHPYQFAYFAPLARPYAEQFSGDYWGIATRQLLEVILERDPSPWIQVNHIYTQTGSINRGNLRDADRKRLDLSYEITEDTDYIIWSRDEKTFDPSLFTKFHVWYELKVDDALIGVVLRRNSASN